VRRTGLLIAGWASASVLGLVLGLQSVSAISDSVTSHPKASLSPESVKAALDRSTAPSSDEASSNAASSDEVPSSEASTVASTPASDASSDVASTSADNHSGQIQSLPGAPDEQSSSSDEASESHGSSTPSAPQDRTYQLAGGSVGVRFENGAAHLLWATPNTGFSVDSNGDSSSVDVRFRSESHESRLKAYWDNGPQQEIEESD